jgi:HK97 family phage major capsid protein
MTIQELLQKKGELAEQAKQILDAADTDGHRDLRSDEETRFEAIHTDIEKLTKQITMLQRQEAVEASLAETQGRRSEPARPGDTRTTTSRTDTRVVQVNQRDSSEALRAWLLPDRARTPEMRESAARAGVRIDAPEITFKLSAVPLASTRSDDIIEWRRRNDEYRAAMGTTSGAVGSYTVPDAAMQALEIALLAFGGIRQVATVIRTDTGASLPFPTSDDTSNKGAILTENTQVSEVDVTFGQLTLDAYMYSSKSVLVSLQLLQDSSVDVPSMIGRMLGERIGRIQSDHFTTGTGSSQPNGIVTAATSGVTGVADPPTYDNFVDLVHSVDPAYRTGARFMLNDATLKSVKKIKVLQYSGDATGIPLWSPGLTGGTPDTILGYPYVINQSMASPGSTAKKVIFGELSKYLIRDVREVTLVRLNERYADYHQVGFLAFARSDGDLLDAGTHPVKYMSQT